MPTNIGQPGARPVPAEIKHIRRGALAASTSLTPVAEGDGIGAGRFRLKKRPNDMYAVFDGGDYVVTTGTRDLDKAEVVLDVYEMQAEAAQEGYFDVRYAKAEEVMAEFVAVEDRPAGTQRSIDDAFRRLQSFVAGKLVRELDNKWLKATKTALKRMPQKPRTGSKMPPPTGYADASIVLGFAWLSVAIEHWCDEKKTLSFLPFTRPGRVKGRKRVFTAKEQAIILRWARGTERVDRETGTWTPSDRPLSERELHERRMIERMFVISMATASRPGAAWGLARRRSFHCPYIHEQTLFRLPVGAIAPRNKLAPAVQLSPDTMTHVRRWDDEDGAGRNYILHRFGGDEPLSAPACARRWAKAMKRLGIKGRRHACRHTMVTGLVAENTPAIVISALAGMSLQTIRRDYNHNDDRSLQPVAFTAVDAVLRNGLDIVVRPD